MGRISSAVLLHPHWQSAGTHTHTRSHSLNFKLFQRSCSPDQQHWDFTSAQRVRILHMKCLDFSTWICGDLIWVEQVC